MFHSSLNITGQAWLGEASSSLSILSPLWGFSHTAWPGFCKLIISQKSLDALMCATLIMIVLVLMADFDKPKERKKDEEEEY